jgi:hypothetical protein
MCLLYFTLNPNNNVLSWGFIKYMATLGWDGDKGQPLKVVYDTHGSPSIYIILQVDCFQAGSDPTD